MRKQLPLLLLLVLVLGLGLAARYASRAPAAPVPATSPREDGQSETRLTTDQVMAMPKIDAHAHLGAMSAARTQAFVRFLEKNDMRWLDICTGGMDRARLDAQIETAIDLHRSFPEQIAWATSFHLSGWGEAGWAKAAAGTVADGVSNGAAAVKIWKDVGMVLKDADGSYVMPDDGRLDPVYDRIEAEGVPLVAHLGEPRNCWLPLDRMTTASDRGYFSKNPQYHGFLHPEVPGYEKQVAARDAILQRHPKLRVVGCHLASLEYDVDEVAKRLDRYPNLAVDLAARIVHLQVQEREKVRNFLIRYQDRILYGTDMSFGGTDEQPPEEIERALADLAAAYRLDAAWLATDEEVEVPRVAAGFKSRGLALPESVLRKIYFENARTWYGL